MNQFIYNMLFDKLDEHLHARPIRNRYGGERFAVANEFMIVKVLDDAIVFKHKETGSVVYLDMKSDSLLIPKEGEY